MTMATPTHFVSPFNGAVETGLRALCVLNAAFPSSYALQRLVVFDYFLVHSDDVEGGPKGLHPQTPYRGGEILVRRGMIQAGLKLYESRGLIERVYKKGGIYFAATDTSADFLDILSAEYLNSLRERADWVVNRFGSFDDAELDALVREHVGDWGAEFEELERVQELGELLAEANRPKNKPKAELPDAAVSSAEANPFSREVEALLRAWHFPGVDRVSFSEKDQDVVIGGRPRRSHGKGVRAITRAAFNLALLRLCIEDERPFPNFVLIDSPLLVYEEPDADESSFPQDIKKHFWESVKASFLEAQVIIIENSHQLPRDGTLDGANVQLFTGNDLGRRGFIPQASGDS